VQEINKIKVVKKILYPYPIIIYSNIFNNNQLEQIKLTLDQKNINFDKNVMGGRKTILKGSCNYQNFIKKNNIANFFNNFFDNKNIFNYFYYNLLNINKTNNYKFSLINKKINFLEYYISRENSVYFKIKNKLLREYSRLKNNYFIYCDLDFSVAAKGYEREPHHDKNDRILNFLLYFNSFESQNGGDFQVFKYKKNPDSFLRQPKETDLTIVETIRPVAGNLVTFLSSPDSIHGVEKIVNDNEKRYFMYGSYTALNEVIWSQNKA
jgi:hypothetical protein